MKNFKCLVLFLIGYSCALEVKEFSEIKKLSKVDFPEQSKVIFYNDDYE